jgi:class 3 adenylate cyclase
MASLMDLDLENLGLTEIIRLQNHLSEILHRRFTRSLGLAFTDIVGSTAYFARFGDEAGHRIQQRHFDLLDRALVPRGGRIVDTAGDGAFSCFPTAEAGAAALLDFFRLLCDDNAARPHGEELAVRASLHWGPVLTDGALVSGEAVNLAARVSETGAAGEIRLTLEAFRELPGPMKLRCLRLMPVLLKGVPNAVELLVLAWQDRSLFPVSVRIDETGQVIALPRQDVISFGRLRESEGPVTTGSPVGGPPHGNDVVLALPDPAANQGISRWHFELRRKADGFVLRPVSSGLTEVDGVAVQRGAEAPIGPGSVVRVARVLTLTFVGAPSNDDAGLSTVQTL